MQTTHSNGRVQTSLVTSKIRVLPMKKQTITCLELLRATILARLVSTVINSLTKKIGQVVYWVDSRTVLCWIRNEKQYVWNSTSETEWIHTRWIFHVKDMKQMAVLRWTYPLWHWVGLCHAVRTWVEALCSSSHFLSLLRSSVDLFGSIDC